MNLNDKRVKNRKALSRHRQAEYTKLMRLINNRYSYVIKEKPEGVNIPFRYIEKTVGEYGRVAIYKHPDYGVAAYKAVMAGNLNIYGLPNKYFLYTANGRNNVAQVDVDNPDLLILTDNFNGWPLSQIAERYAEMLGKIRETISTNIVAMRTPYIIQAPKERTLEVKLALEAINEAPEVIVDDNFDFAKTINVVELKTPDNLETLEVEYHNTLSRFLEEIGFSSVLITKKERLVSAEADANGSTLIAFDNEAYEARVNFVLELEKKFGIKVDLIKSNIDILRDFGKTTETRPVVTEEKELQ